VLSPQIFCPQIFGVCQHIRFFSFLIKQITDEPILLMKRAEHTEFETLDYKATLETVMLLETIFENDMITEKLVATCKS
jgi:hypothetical protein